MSSATPETHAIDLPPVTADTSVAERFRAVAAAAGRQVALTTADRDYDFATLDRWSDAVATDLLRSGGDPDRPVVILTGDNAALVPAALGVIKAGRYFVVIDPVDPDDRIALLMAESRADRALIASSRVPDAVTAVPRVELAGPDRQAVPPSARPNEYLFGVYTSGTTGKPKGVRTRQRGWVASRVRPGANWITSSNERLLYASPPGFARAPYGLLNGLVTGSTLCAFDARNESIAALAQFIATRRVMSLGLTPAQFRRLLSLPAHEVDFRHVRRVVLGADVVTRADVDAFRAAFPGEATLVCAYASTETGLALQLAIGGEAQLPANEMPMGRPVPGVELRLLDDEGRDVAEGETGELVISGPEVTEGYWNAPELTAEKFASHPEIRGQYSFLTGDLARRDSDGYYYFAGRKDARLRIHGRRLDPVEVETAMLATGHVREAVAVAKQDEHGEARLVAYVVAHAATPSLARNIRAAMRKSVPAWMIPSRIIALAEIPMTAGAKVDRKALTSRADPAVDVDSGAGDSLEHQLASIWSRVIGVPVRVDDDFFDDLGGESIVGAHLVTAIAQELGERIPLSILLELNTVRKMATYFRAPRPARPIAVAIQEGTDPDLPPLFLVSGRGGAVIKFRDLARLLGPAQSVYGLQPHGFTDDDFPKKYEEVVVAYANAIRAIQPSGPYYLGGYSFGGMVVFHIARYLELRGERVALLAILDAALPQWVATTRRRPYLWRRATRLLRFVSVPKRLLDVPRNLKHRFRTRPRGIRNDALPEWVARTEERITTLPRDGTLGRYQGPVTLFRARWGARMKWYPDDLGWREAARGGLTIIDVEGDHDSMLVEHVRSLALPFREAMAAAREAEAALAAQP
jgi:amino acid adenylation domain-containing protein